MEKGSEPRQDTLKTFIRFARDDQAFLPSVLNAAEDKDEHIRELAFWGLSELAPHIDLRPHISVVLKGTTDLNQEVRRWAIVTLREMGPGTIHAALPSLTRSLGDPEPAIRDLVASTLLVLLAGFPPFVIDDAQDANHSSLISNPEDAAQAILLGPADPNPFAKILSGLSAQNPLIQRAASLGLVRLLRHLLHAVVLKSLSPESDEDVRRDCVLALADVGGIAVAKLIEFLQDPAASVRRQAAIGLASLGPLCPRVPSELTRILTHPQASVRSAAALALGEFGSAGSSAFPALVNLLDDDEDDVRYFAWQALETIGHPAPEASRTIVRLLVPYLQSPRHEVRLHAAMILANQGVEICEVASDLLSRLQHESDEELRFWLVAALCATHSPDPQIIARIMEAADDEVASVRCLAVKALGDVFPYSEIVKNVLLKHLGDEDPDVRLKSAISLTKLDPRLEDPLDILLKALQHSSDPISPLELIRALGRLCPYRPAAVAALIQAAKDPNEDVRQAAQECLTAIDAQEPKSASVTRGE